jgi:DNA-binding transcriptional MerR regulator
VASSQRTPTFNLKAVVQQTGVKPDTLRAWERRYGLPQPHRSPGGHRLYSHRDIQIIQWLAARQHEGLSISRAVDLWHQIESEGRDPLRTAAPMAPPGPVVSPSLPTGEAIDQLRQAWVSACEAFDEQQAERILSQAFAVHPPEVVCLELLQKGVAEIGEAWYKNRMTVQQEHFATELAIRQVEALIMAAPAPTRSGRILIGAPPEEEHIFSLLLLSFLLRRRGWDIRYLGANVPMERLETTMTAVGPQLVILAAQRLYTASTLLEMATLLQQENIPLAFGGRVFTLLPSLRPRIPGHFLGEGLEEAPQGVEGLMSMPRPSPEVKAASEAYRQARAHYMERQARIEATVGERAEAMGIQAPHLVMAHRELALNIEAGLTLGDMRFLGVDIEWVEGLLGYHCIPRQVLSRYLRTYHHAAQEHLDERGRPVLDWLATLNGALEWNEA